MRRKFTKEPGTHEHLKLAVFFAGGSGAEGDAHRESAARDFFSLVLLGVTIFALLARFDPAHAAVFKHRDATAFSIDAQTPEQNPLGNTADATKAPDPWYANTSRNPKKSS